MSSKKERVYKYIKMALAALFAGFVFAVGKTIDLTDTIYLNDVSMFIKMAVITFLSFGIMAAGDLIINKIKSKGVIKVKELPKWTVIIPLASWIVSWLAIFPGVFSYDCYEEWQMIANNSLTSHHPVLHVLMLGGLTNISDKLFGNGNVGIAVYVGIQIAFYVFVFLRMNSFLKTEKKYLAQWIALVFYTVSPVIMMFVIATTKDSIFAAFELWFIINCLRLERGEKLKDKLFITEFILSAAGTMIFRKNGLYIVVLVMIYLLIRYFKSEKRLFMTVAIIALVYFLYSVPFFAVLNVGKTSSAEMMAVPIQQLARVYRFNSESLTNEDKEVMFEVIPEEYWKLYIPTTVDSIKNGFDNDAYARRKVEFYKVWIKQGLKNPMTYVNAFMANTVDFWCPISVNDGYRWLYAMDSDDKSTFFDYRVAPPGEKITIIKPIYALINYLSTEKEVTTGVLSIFLNSGWYILAWLVSVVFTNKRNKKYTFHIIMLLSLLSVLAGPMALVRYVLIFYLVLPLEIQ